MEKIIGKIVGLGIPGLILLVAINATGLAGAAAITAALAAIGPAGMIGGVITLCVAGMIADGITEYGFEKILCGVVKELYKRGETEESIRKKIQRYPVTKELKDRLLGELSKLQMEL